MTNTKDLVVENTALSAEDMKFWMQIIGEEPEFKQKEFIELSDEEKAPIFLARIADVVEDDLSEAIESLHWLISGLEYIRREVSNGEVPARMFRRIQEQRAEIYGFAEETYFDPAELTGEIE